MKKIKTFLFTLLVISLFLFGVVALFNQQISSYLLNHHDKAYQDVSAQVLKKNQEKKGDFDFSKVQPLDFKNILAHQFDHDLPVIGAIVIPEVQLDLPIFNGVGGGNLWYGAGTLKDGQVMGEGNYSLAGHNMDGFSSDDSLLFTPLERVKKGMQVVLLDGSEQYDYQIDDIEIISPEHGAVINDHDGKKELTLITCADAAATKRLMIHGQFIGKIKENK